MPLPDNYVERFWAKDPTLWPGGAPEEVGAFLGWVDILSKIESRFEEIDAFVDDVKAAGFRQVVLCGMGGSSLAPYVFAKIGGVQEGGIPVHVLDSTHPGAIAEVHGRGIAETLFVIASKSGSTAEPSAFDAYFFDCVGDPSAFVAITDPGSPFEASALARGFRKIFLNYADIGGRFSALSLFGLVPAALLGLNYREMVRRAHEFAVRQSSLDAEAFRLGIELGESAMNGVDKLTILTHENDLPFGLWLEQLVAESTGKHGKGILPVAGEALGNNYGEDRFFAAINQDIPREPGHRFEIRDPLDLGAEFMRWEIATAVAGSVIGINPFDQPNVQESKDVTKRLLGQIEATGELPPNPSLETPHGDLLVGFLSDLQPGDFVVIQAYLHESPDLDRVLHQMQAALRDRYGVPVCMGYGPRFLHSTGQFHKGGPNRGRFIQLIDRPVLDFPIPNQSATWRQFVHAQAQGDFEALAAKDRRILAIDLGGDPATAIAKLLP